MKMTKEEIKNYVIEHKECCKKLAEEYRQRYNEDNTDKLALNMFYHNVISYNDFETILATIEDRNSMIMCFSKPPILSEKTVEVELNRIEKLEKDKQYFSDSLDKQIEATLKLQQENAELKTIIESEHEIEARKNNKLISQLIKAKKILKILLENYVSEPEGFSDGSCEDNELRNLINEVEQFLKDSEVEK